MYYVNMSIYFEQLKGNEYSGVRELADAAERILRTTGQSQERGTVAEYPNERTIRYYITEGLLPPSMEKRGAASLFGYQHLLALLVIKKLQADGLPISIIRQLITGKSDSDLEALIGEQVRVEVTRDAAAIRDYTSQRNEANSAKEYLEGLLFSRSSRDESSIAFSRPASPPASAAPIPNSAIEPAKAASWRREEIAPGLEMHIRDDFKPPAGYRETSKLLAKIKQILRR